MSPGAEHKPRKLVWGLYSTKRGVKGSRRRIGRYTRESEAAWARDILRKHFPRQVFTISRLTKKEYTEAEQDKAVRREWVESQKRGAKKK